MDIRKNRASDIRPLEKPDAQYLEESDPRKNRTLDFGSLEKPDSKY